MPHHITAPAAPGRVRVLELLARGDGGGAQEHVRTLAEGLPTERYELRVASLSGGSALDQIGASGTSTIVLPSATDAQAVDELLRYLRAWRPAVLHAHMFRAELVAALAIAALEATGEPRPYLLATIHSSRIRSSADQAALASLNGRFDRLIAVSRAMIDKLAHEGRAGVPVELIYDGIDLARFAPRTPEGRARLGYGPNDRLIGAIGRLEPEKGQEVLLAAWPAIVAREPRARLLLVGEGSMRSALESQADSLGAAGKLVRFLGWRDDVAALLSLLEVVVLPSHREALGLALIEAMAAGRPVVASAVGGVPEIIEDGRTGVLVRPADAGALAAAITGLLEDTPRAARLAGAGRRRALARFGQERMLVRIAALYETGAAARTGDELPVTRARAARSSRRRAARS